MCPVGVPHLMGPRPWLESEDGGKKRAAPEEVCATLWSVLRLRCSRCFQRNILFCGEISSAIYGVEV